MSDDVQQPTPAPIPSPSVTNKKPRRFRAWMILAMLAGVVLPCATVIAELTLRICSSVFFDPLSTGWHVALWSIIPLANLIAMITHIRGSSTWVRPATFLLGVSIGTTVVYCIQFLPFVHFSLLAVVALGIGLGGLSPYLALASSLVCKRNLGRLELIDKRQHGRLIWTGVIIAVAVSGTFIFSGLATEQGLRMAASPDQKTSARGVRLIRRFGSNLALLRACYELPSTAWPGFPRLENTSDPVRRRTARDTFYRVTGSTFTSMAPPKLFGPRSEWVSDFQSDLDVGGTEVNSVAIDLSLSSSRMDTVVDPNSLVAYSEWTLTFANSAQDEREARTEIALPPGGVVSRLTLWVNGEEREAAFSTRGKVRAAYQEVAVVQQRDPVLVTSCGTDRVLVQCFPVPPAGTMKVRLGITAPLIPEDYSRGALVLPHFAERNFAVPAGIEHSLYARSPQRIMLGGSEIFSDGNGSLRTMLSDADLSGARSCLICSRNPNVNKVWTPDRMNRQYAIVQSVGPSASAPLQRVVVVVDSSKRMHDSLAGVADALGKLPSNMSVSVVVANDNIAGHVSDYRPSEIQAASNQIVGINCIGGIDNRQALVRAIDESRDSPSRSSLSPVRILWVHGPQPLKSDSLTDQLLQRIQNEGSAPIYSVAAVEGTNTILADLEGTGAVTVVPRRGSISDDLSRLFNSWKKPPLAVFRERIHVAAATGTVRGSSHVCRLWAKDEVSRVCSIGDSRVLPKASEMASAYQLVTTVSGAVVLETEQQYKDAGLKPVDPKTTPSTVPEPTGLVVLAAGLVPIWRLVRRRRS